MKVKLPPRRPGCVPEPHAELAARANHGHRHDAVLIWLEEPGEGSEEVALSWPFPRAKGRWRTGAEVR